MKEITETKRCTGCTTCANVCPKKAIKMIENKEGFLYPTIDKEKCVNCGLCKKKCPINSLNENKSTNKCYVGYDKNTDRILDKASSGNIFELLANYILREKGIVIGAAFNENNELKHIVINNVKDLKKLKGSKYLQSDLNDIISYLKNISSDKMILFAGTPCQVAAVKNVIKKDNLFCVDIICHGVPSPKLFKKYIVELENKVNDKVIDYNFRSKVTGWDSYSNTIEFKNKTKSMFRFNNPYMKLFLSNVCLRESCYNCKFKLGNKYSDITLGDFWGIKNYYKDMYNNNKGVSAIIINTSKGEKLFNEIVDEINYRECDIKEIVIGNTSLTNSCQRPESRNVFFEEMNRSSIKKLEKKYGLKISYKQKVKNILKLIIK